jgi:hypothetical protein
MPHPPRRLFAGVVDDAALFPPGNAPMHLALAEHARHRNAAYAGLVGPFLCPTTRVDELRETLPPGQALAVSLVVDGEATAAWDALAAAGADDRLALVAVEAPHARLGHDAATVGAKVRRLPSVTGFLEVDPRDLEMSLDLVAPSGGWQAAKFRTGGTSADSFPTERQLADFLVAGVERGLPFKLTAGLHHAVRHTDAATGFEHHGLLNVLVATADALAREDLDIIVASLAERDQERVVDRVRSWSELDCLAIRGSFRSFGCCGVTEPITELAALGLLGNTA